MMKNDYLFIDLSVSTSGQLRDDLFAWLQEWEDRTDLVLVLGTSLSGMNADRMVWTVLKERKQLEGKRE